jgi:hypothetical protein
MSRDIRIRKPFFEGEMIVFVGSVLCMGVFFVLANRKARKLMENAEDLHGSARWASEEDIHDTGLLKAKYGVYVGGWSCKVGFGPLMLPSNGRRTRIAENWPRGQRLPVDEFSIRTATLTLWQAAWNAFIYFNSTAVAK